MLPKTPVFHIVPGMGLSLKGIGKALKRVARSKIVQGGLSVATGGLSDKVLSVGKALGATIQGNKMLKKQQKSVAAATEKLRAMPAPGVVGTATGSTGDGTAWINQKTAGSGAKAAKRSLSKGSTKGKKGASSSRSKKPKRTSSAERTSAKPAKKKKSSGGGRTPPKQSEATQKKFAANAELTRKKSAQWKKMSDAEKKAAGGWKAFAFGKR